MGSFSFPSLGRIDSGNSIESIDSVPADERFSKGDEATNLLQDVGAILSIPTERQHLYNN